MRSKSVEHLFLSAWENYDWNNWDKMIEDADLVLTKDSQNPYGWNYRGVGYYHKSDFKMAIECFSKSIQYKDQDGVFWLNRGCAYYNLEDFSSALINFTKADEIFMPWIGDEIVVNKK